METILHLVTLVYGQNRRCVHVFYTLGCVFVKFSSELAMQSSGAVGLYWERLDSVGRNIQRLAPLRAPSEAGERTTQLFQQLHALLAAEQARSPEDVAAMLDQWMAIEEEAAQILRDASEESPSNTSSWSSLTPLRALSRLASAGSMAELAQRLDSPRARAASMATGLSSLKQMNGGGGDGGFEPPRDELLNERLEAVRETLLAKASC